MNAPRIGSLCSGYGGLELAVLDLLGGRVAWHVEHNPDASKILAHHWPDVPNHHDVKTTDWTKVEHVDILTAGYPCQPFSHAGRRGGENDPRHLWPDVLRAIRTLRPRLVLLENVLGHLTLGFGTVLGDLAAAGLDAEWVVLRASDVGAPHGRARLFIAAADTSRDGRDEGRPEPARLQRRPHASVSGDGPCPTCGDPIEHHDAGGFCAGRCGGTCTDPEFGRPTATADAGRARLAQQPGSAPVEEAGPRTGAQLASDRGPRAAAEWGPYRPAIARWERVLGRPAPRPTEPSGRADRERLSPRFVEWLMGLPDGHVTDPAIGISRNAQLTALGNGVVPQQAAAAYRELIPALLRPGAAA